MGGRFPFKPEADTSVRGPTLGLAATQRCATAAMSGRTERTLKHPRESTNFRSKDPGFGIQITRCWGAWDTPVLVDRSASAKAAVRVDFVVIVTVRLP
jgi:hypothetical protein